MWLTGSFNSSNLNIRPSKMPLLVFHSWFTLQGSTEWKHTKSDKLETSPQLLPKHCQHIYTFIWLSIKPFAAGDFWTRWWLFSYGIPSDYCSYAHLAKIDIEVAPIRRKRLDKSWSFALPCILGCMISAAKRSTRAMYMRIPADAELRTPWTCSAVGLFPSYTDEIPVPIPMPMGVVREKNIVIIAVAASLNLAC